MPKKHKVVFKCFQKLENYFLTIFWWLRDPNNCFIILFHMTKKISSQSIQKLVSFSPKNRKRKNTFFRNFAVSNIFSFPNRFFCLKNLTYSILIGRGRFSGGGVLFPSSDARFSALFSSLFSSSPFRSLGILLDGGGGRGEIRPSTTGVGDLENLGLGSRFFSFFSSFLGLDFFLSSDFEDLLELLVLLWLLPLLFSDLADFLLGLRSLCRDSDLLVLLVSDLELESSDGTDSCFSDSGFLLFLGSLLSELLELET